MSFTRITSIPTIRANDEITIAISALSTIFLFISSTLTFRVMPISFNREMLKQKDGYNLQNLGTLFLTQPS